MAKNNFRVVAFLETLHAAIIFQRFHCVLRKFFQKSFADI